MVQRVRKNGNGNGVNETGQTGSKSPKALALIELLADPTDSRSLTEKAALVGMSRTWASTLANRPEVDAEVSMRRKMALRQGSVPKAYRALAEKVEQGGRDCVNAARLILQAAGEIQTGVNVTTNVTQVSVTDEDRENRVGFLRERRLAADKG